MKNSGDTIGNRSHDLPVFSAVAKNPQVSSIVKIRLLRQICSMRTARHDETQVVFGKFANVPVVCFNLLKNISTEIQSGYKLLEDFVIP
jgi:hypothetical protein